MNLLYIPNPPTTGDCSPFLNQAIKTALSLGLDGIRLGPGIYNLNHPLKHITHERDARGIVIEGSGYAFKLKVAGQGAVNPNTVEGTVLNCLVPDSYAIQISGRSDVLEAGQKWQDVELYQRRIILRHLGLTTMPIGKDNIRPTGCGGLQATGIYGLRLEDVRFHWLTGTAMQIGGRSWKRQSDGVQTEDWCSVLDVALQQVYVTECDGWGLDTLSNEIQNPDFPANGTIHNLLVQGGQFYWNKQGGIRGVFAGAIFDAVNFSINGEQNQRGQGCGLVLADDGYTPSRGVIVRACTFDQSWDAHVLIERAYSCQFIANQYVSFKDFPGHPLAWRPLRNTVIGKADSNLHYLRANEIPADKQSDPNYIVAKADAQLKPDSSVEYVRNIVFDLENISGFCNESFVAYDFVKCADVEVMRQRIYQIKLQDSVVQCADKKSFQKKYLARWFRKHTVAPYVYVWIDGTKIQFSDNAQPRLLPRNEIELPCGTPDCL